MWLMANGCGEPLATARSIMEVAANTMPQTIAIACRRLRLRFTTLPASWWEGRIPGLKTVGATTNAKKIMPPIQTTSESSIRNRTNDINASGETLHCKRAPELAASFLLDHVRFA